jgi:DNA polymerase-3 subunit beta
MKFIASSAALKSKLAPMFRCINTNTVLPILESVYVSANDKGKVILETTDLENVMIAEVDVHVGKTGGVCIPGTLLRSAISCEDQPLTIECDANFVVTIIGCDFKIKIEGENPNNWPKRAEFDNNPEHPIHSFATYDTKDILPILSTAVQFTSNDDLRPSMTGVFFHKRSDEKTLWIIATDAHRLYYKSLPAPETLKTPKMIVPQKPIRLLSQIKKAKQITIEQNDLHARFKLGGYTLLTRHIDARYPDYQAIMPKEVPFSFKLFRKEAIAFVNIAQNFSNKSTMQMVLKVDPSNQRIELTTADIDFNMEFSCNLRAYDMKMEGELRIAFNARFILHNLQQSKDEYVLIEHLGISTKAIIMDQQILTMPLMLNS